MPALEEILRRDGISEDELLRISKRLEEWTPDDRRLAGVRARHRRLPGHAAYEDVGLAKPRSGRGIGRKHLRAALAGRPIPRVPRAKLARAVAAAVRRRDARATTAAILAGIPGRAAGLPASEARS